MCGLYKICFIVVSLAASVSQSSAQAWPSKPIKAIVPIAAGSLTDIVPRIVFEQLSKQLGQTIIVENRPGAGSTVGSAAVARADADGYTLLVNSSAHTIAPSLYRSLGYDPLKDFTAVILLGVSPFVLVVSPDRGFKTADELVTASKANSGAFNFSSPGVGSASHLSAERFNRSAGIQAIHVPFRGGSEALTEVLAGRIDFFWMALGAALPQIRDGKLTALAVNGAKRSDSLPDVPTTAEAGYRNAEYPTWFGLFLPAKTPQDVLEHLAREAANALLEPKVRGKLADLGVEPLFMTPGEFETFVAQQILADAELVRTTGLRGQ